MKSFFKIVFASMVGYILAVILVLFIVIGILGSVASNMGNENVEIKDKSVLELSFENMIPERTPSNPLKFLDFNGDMNQPMGLNDIIAEIKHASKDSHIKGIYIDATSITARQATLEEIRNALIDFKKSGKWIIAYSEMYTKPSYYISSVADKIYLNPAGDMIFNGMYSEITFFKHALEKLGIEMQIIRHGKYKGAVEPFILDKLSDDNRKQITDYVSSLWNHYTERVGQSRKISQQEIKKIADELLIQSAADAKKYNMVDELFFKDQVLSEIRKRISLGEKDKISFVSMNKYSKTVSDENDSKNKIAMIYANGDINGGNGSDESIGSEGLSETIRKARTDEKIKAIVLRVNSPGGSALASDVIWREVMLAKKEKPVVISMGDVAASGGYYIACGANKIIAQPNTITGSIGVFGMLPNNHKLYNEKLGLNFDGVKTGKYSDLGNTDRGMTTDENAIMQHYVDRIYDDFISKVADGRHMEKTKVDELAQGHVFTGEDALKLGLVDELGGIDEAVKAAAKLANLSNYKIKYLPKQKNPFEQFVKNISGDEETKFMKNKLGEYYDLYMKLSDLKNMNGVQARLPYELKVK